MWFKQTPDEKNPYVRIVEHLSDARVIENIVCKGPGPAVPGQLRLAEIAVVQTPLNSAHDENEALLTILVAAEKIPFPPPGFDAVFVLPGGQSSHDFAYRLARSLLSPLEDEQELNCDPNDIQALVRQGSGSAVCEYGLGNGMGPEAGTEAARQALGQLSGVLCDGRPGGLLVSVIANSRAVLFEAVKGVCGQVQSVGDGITSFVGGDVELGPEAGQVDVHMYFFTGPGWAAPVATTWEVGDMEEDDIPMFLRKPVFEEGKP